MTHRNSKIPQTTSSCTILLQYRNKVLIFLDCNSTNAGNYPATKVVRLWSFINDSAYPIMVYHLRPYMVGENVHVLCYAQKIIVLYPIVNNFINIYNITL
jgi:hypothetical protein